MRTTALLLVAATLATSSLAMRPERATATDVPTTSPPEELLVVTTNLKEAFDPSDVAETSDMRNYVRRLLNQVPYIPDVLLLQEVRRSSATAVARRLSRVSGHAFRVAARPGEPPWIEKDDRILDRETAVLVNSTTVDTMGRPGRFTTRYPERDANPREPVRVRNHSLVSVREVVGASSMTVASVHYVQNHFLASDEVGDEYKKRWAIRSVELLRERSARDATQSILLGGDFNASRGTRDDQANHSHSPWLMAITSEPFELLDAVWEATREGGPDYLFTPAAVRDAGVDMYYDTQEARRAGYFYSDHRFRWALIAPGEKGEPYPVDRF